MTDDTTPETARLTADIALFSTINGNLHVLVIKRAWPPFEGRWALPGGHVDTGEPCLNAAHRELAEETGIHVSNLRSAAVYADPGRDPRGRYVTFAYTAHLNDTPDPTAGDDAAEAAWIPAHDIIEGRVKAAFDHARIISDALDFLTFAPGVPTATSIQKREPR